MAADIEIHYGKIPKEIVNDFETSIDKSISLTLHHEHGKVNHFEEAADIFIYVNEHLTELIVGVTGSLLYDGVKYAIKASWKKLRDHYSKQKKSEKYREGKDCIELNFKIAPDKTVECSLAGNVAAESIEVLTEKMFEYLKDEERRKRDFDNPDLRENSYTKPRIRIRYNPETNQYEPVSFAEMRKKDEEMMKSMMRKLQS